MQSTFKERESQAKGIYEEGLRRVSSEPDPKGQKFPSGSRVRIADDLGSCMGHFECSANATVNYTYAHAYGGSNVKSYSLTIDDYGSSAWYYEHQLTAI